MSANSLPEDVRREYPFEPKSMEIDGHRYSYVDEGTGPTLLFVHGNPTWSFAWRNLIKEFRSDFRCIAVDHLGMGLSATPADYDYTIAGHIQNLSHLVTSLDLSEVTLIGHDWGGCIGMGAAGQNPQRFSRFVMMNTAAFRSKLMPLRIAVCRIPVLGAIGVRGMNLFSRAALTMAVEVHSKMTPAVKKGYLWPYSSWSERIAVHRFVQEIPLRPSHPTWPTLVEVENGLDQFQNHPMLLLWGAKDWCFTTAFRDEWQARFPNAESVTFDQAGHYVFEDAGPEIASELQRFLESSHSRQAE